MEDENIVKLKEKINELEFEKQETNDMIEFLTSERLVLLETLKEFEDNLKNEHALHNSDRKALDELEMRSKKLYEKVENKSEEISNLNKIIEEKDKEIESLKVNVETCNYERNELLKLFEINKDVIVNSEKKDEFITIIISKINEYQNDIEKLVSENYNYKRDLAIKDERIKNLEENEVNHKITVNNYREKIDNLTEGIQTLSEKYRCQVALRVEMDKQIKELSEDKFGSCMLNNPLIIKQELAKCREMVTLKDELLNKMNSRYNKHREILEYNERKANEEIKKLDEIIDNVIKTLKENETIIEQSPSLKNLLTELND